MSSTFPIRSSFDLWAYLDLLRQGSDVAPCFHDGVCLTVRVPDGIDELRRAEALLSLRRMVWRHYALLKYGTPRLKRLTARDRVESAINVAASGCTTLTVDFSSALNACVRAAEQRRQEAETPDYQQSQFPEDLQLQVFAQAGERKDIGKVEAARDVAVNWFGRLTPTHRVATAFFAIACLALGLTTIGYVKVSGDRDVQVLNENHRHEEQMVAFKEPTITTEDGHHVRLPRKEVAALDHATHEDVKRFAELDSAYENEPAYRLVKDELDDVRPALLKLALSGSLEINGLSFDAKSADRVARKARAKTQSVGGWRTKVRRVRDALVS